MKKRISSLLATMVLALFLCIPALATGFDEAGLYFVTDEAGLLSDQECLELERRAEEISLKYKCGVYIILLDDFTAYTYDETVYEAAKTLYQEYSLGYGEEKSGELLLLSMAERDYTLIAYGYGNTAFTDYGKDKLSEVFLDDFGDDNWYSGLSDYLDKSESMLQSAREGHPLDVDSNPLIVLVGIGISLLVGCVAAFVIAVGLSSRLMKSVSAKTEANAYLIAGSVEITGREDHFTHTTEIRQKIETDSGSGGTTVDSDGFSGKSGKF